jgi:hypothetical protein
MPQWDYCSINPMDNTLTLYTDQGPEVREQMDVALTIAALGSQGWELVAGAPQGTLYFKRPKAELPPAPPDATGDQA